jgi:hypothetical protein
MKKIFLSLLVVAAVAIAGSAQAQGYSSALGARFGSPFAASYKFFVTDPGAIELFAGFRGYGAGYSWLSANGAYEHHFPISGVTNLSWYVGGGAGVQFWSWRNNNALGGNTSISIFGVLGLDYKFEEIPLNLSLDWMPTFFVNGYLSDSNRAFNGGFGSLSARYVLN